MITFSRRAFLRLGALAGVASGLPWARKAAADGDVSGADGVKHYATLGRTGLRISDISFGSSRLRDGGEDLVRHALDRGVNYFDTAESYSRGRAEVVLGNALTGVRDRVHIATKIATRAHDRASDMMVSLEACLRRLQTDYVDVFFSHAVNDIERLENPAWAEFVERAKRQGKIRFSGISGHAGRLVECIDYALDHDLADVILAAHNFGQDPAFYEQFIRDWDMVAVLPDLPRVLTKAKEKNVGVIAMKVLRGARLNDMRPFEEGGRTYAQAAFRWVLNRPFTDAAIITMSSREEIDEYLGASGSGEVTAADRRLLMQYARLTAVSYCQHGCDDCEGACPHEVPIADVLRTRMYATDYGDLEFARDEYRQLGEGAEPCLTCDGQPCLRACTHGLAISRLTRPTHQMLA